MERTKTMNCIYCRSETSVANSRPQKRLNQVWRRRKCRQCSATFTTIEALSWEQSILVMKRGGKIRPFSREKLFISLVKACDHRPDGVNDASALTGTVMGKIAETMKEEPIATKLIATLAAESLQNFDQAAFMAYTSRSKQL